MAIAKPCSVCGVRVPDGQSKCSAHRGGAGRRRPCATCGIPTDRGNYCPDHDPVTNAAVREQRQPWRAGYRDPNYYREAQAAKKRDGNRCCDCGKGKGDRDRKGRPVRLHADHVIALRDGLEQGIPLEQLNHRDNMRTRCGDCHDAKTQADAARRRGAKKP